VTAIHVCYSNAIGWLWQTVISAAIRFTVVAMPDGAALALTEPHFQQAGVAALLGLLVGLQRERAATGIAGMRIFPLITVFGCPTARLAVDFQEI
jgi:hypothetical protein